MILSRCLAFVGVLLGGNSRTQAAPLAIDYGSASRTEISLGIAPPRYGVNAEPSVAIEQIPASAIRFWTPSAMLMLRYQQRWYWRNPNISSSELPLLYHMLVANYSRTLTARLSVTAGANVGYGTLDYASFVSYTSPTAATPSVPQFGVAKTIVGTGNLGFNYQVTPRLAWGIGLNASRRESINQNGIAPGLGTAQSTGLAVNAMFQLSNRTELSGSVSGTRSEIQPQPNVRILVGQLRASHHFSPRSVGSAAIGATFLSPEGGLPFWYPTVQASYTNSSGREGHRITLGVTSGLFAYVDVISGRTRTNATLSGVTTMELGSRWTATAAVGTMLPTSRQPIGARTAESSAQVSITLARPIGNHAEFFTGARHMMRMTHPNASPFDVLDTQTWVFGGVALWLATPDGTGGRWVL